MLIFKYLQIFLGLEEDIFPPVNDTLVDDETIVDDIIN
jgi:hypothetical protein